MRVGSVSNVGYMPCKRVTLKKQQPVQKNDLGQQNVNFKGRFGQIIGGAFGAGAVLITSFIAAPAAVCLTGAGLIAGIVGGDVAEDAINKDDDSNKNL